MSKCPRYGLFGLAGTRHQKPEALRVAHFSITQGYADEVGPWTHVSWKCKACGALWTTKKKGVWSVEDFN